MPYCSLKWFRILIALEGVVVFCKVDPVMFGALVFKLKVDSVMFGAPVVIYVLPVTRNPHSFPGCFPGPSEIASMTTIIHNNLAPEHESKGLLKRRTIRKVSWALGADHLIQLAKAHYEDTATEKTKGDEQDFITIGEIIF